MKRVLKLRKPGRPPQSEEGAPKTKELLLQVAKDLIDRHGVADLSFKEIAARARVNPALLNYYFGNKNELCTALVKQCYAPLRQLAVDASMTNGDAGTRLGAIIEALSEHFIKEPTAALLISEALSSKDTERRLACEHEFASPLRELVGALLKAYAKDQRQTVPDIDTVLAAILGIGAGRVLFGLVPEGVSPKVIASRARRIVLGGILGD